jgi:hypothetical protein
MEQVLEWIVNAIFGFLAVYIMGYIVYSAFKRKSNISDEDLDRISKGGDH